MEDRVIVQLTEEQINILLGIIDCHTPETEPDKFYDKDSDTVIEWTAEGKSACSVQKYFDTILVRENLDY